MARDLCVRFGEFAADVRCHLDNAELQRENCRRLSQSRDARAPTMHRDKGVG